MKSLDLLFAARPLLQLPIWSVYLVALQFHYRLSGDGFTGLDLLLMGCLSFVFASAAYLNQICDEDSDRINGKLGFLQRGYLTRRQLLVGGVIGSVAPLAVSALISAVTFIIVAQLVLVAFMYSAAPSRLKDRPIWGLIANAWPHGFLVALAIMPDLTLHNMGLLGWDNPVYFFLAVAGTYALTTVADRAGDLAVGKRTLAVVIGRTGAIWVAAVLFGVSAAVAFRSAHAELLYLSMLAMVLALASLLVPGDKPVLFAAKAPILLLTLLAGFWYPAYLMFVVALLVATRIYYARRFGMIYPRMA
jgi:1,4-dihydroxy-2-naphthoate octaprenyltransferase